MTPRHHHLSDTSPQTPTLLSSMHLLEIREWKSTLNPRQSKPASPTCFPKFQNLLKHHDSPTMKKWKLILTWILYAPDFALKQKAPWGSVSVVTSDALSLSAGIMVTLYLLICLTVSGNRVTEMWPHTLNLLNKGHSSEQTPWFDKDHKKLLVLELP